MKALRILGLGLVSLSLAACGGQDGTTAEGSLPHPVGGLGGPSGGNPTPEPTPPLTSTEAQGLFNSALHDALANPGSGVTVTETATTIHVAGALAEGNATVTLDITITKAPFSLSGSATIDAGAHTAVISFGGGTAASVTIDGHPAGSFQAALPMVPSLLLAQANSSIAAAVTPGFAAGTITVTPGASPGQFTIDGSRTLGNLTITFTQVKVDLVARTVTGTLKIVDGNNTAVLTFNGTTVTITVNGTNLGTFNLP